MMRKTWLIAILSLCAFGTAPFAIAAAYWPQFRGPGGSGVAEGQKPPIHFGPGSNELWKASVPAGASSPCVWSQSIFLTAFNDGKLETICLAIVDNKIYVRTADHLWAFGK